MPRSIPFAPKLFPHHFGGICEVWVQPVFQNHDFRFHPTHPQVKKSSQNHQTWPCTNHTKIKFFCSQTLSTSVWKHLRGSSPPNFIKSWFFVFHPTHHQLNNSSQNTKITKLGLATIMPRSIPFPPKLFPHHFGGICEVWVQPLFQNHDFSFFTPHTTNSQNQAKTPKSWNLAIHQPCQDQFLFLPNFSHITLEAFVRI